MYEVNIKNKTVVLSMRLKESIRNKLELESELHNMNVNTLINQILTKYLDWDRYGRDVGSLYITKRFLRGVFAEMTVDKIRILSKSISAPSLRDTVVFMHGELNYSTVIGTIKNWLENSDYQFRHTDDKDEKFVIHHGMGKNWPIYFITMISEVLGEISYGIKDINANDESVCFTIIKTC